MFLEKGHTPAWSFFGLALAGWAGRGVRLFETCLGLELGTNGRRLGSWNSWKFAEVGEGSTEMRA